MSSEAKITLAITLGDPAGVGPELITRSRSTIERLAARTRIIIIGRESHLKRGLKSTGESPFWTKLRDKDLTLENSRGVYLFEPTLTAIQRRKYRAYRPRWGMPQKGNGFFAWAAIRAAADLANRGVIQALTTCPLNKEALRADRINFPGHTEMLAQYANVDRFGMLFDGAKMRVALVTIHEPLRRALDLLTPERIADKISLTAQFMRLYGINDPRIGVPGINPHAGENGLLGSEDDALVRPAVERARKAGIRAEGPIPPDVIFHQAREGRFDAVTALYHDQGLIAMKTLAFHTAVNITMGLPYIRTSPDHGTAYDIAGKGIARTGSFERALRLAIRLAAKQKKLAGTSR